MMHVGRKDDEERLTGGRLDHSITTAQWHNGTTGMMIPRRLTVNGWSPISSTPRPLAATLQPALEAARAATKTPQTSRVVERWLPTDAWRQWDGASWRAPAQGWAIAAGPGGHWATPLGVGARPGLNGLAGRSTGPRDPVGGAGAAVQQCTGAASIHGLDPLK